MSMSNEEKKSFENAALEEATKLLHFEDGDPHLAPSDDLKRRRAIDAALSEAEAQVPLGTDALEASTKDRNRSWFALAIACGVAAVVMVGFFAVKNNRGGVETETVATKNSVSQVKTIKAKVLEVEGENSRGEEVLKKGYEIRLGQSIRAGEGNLVLSFGQKIKAKIYRDTKIKIERLDKELVEIFVENGEVLASVDPQKTETIFMVSTNFGRAIVTGTLFSVSATHKKAIVKVFRGSVRVDGKDGGSSSVTASNALEMGKPATMPIELPEVAMANIEGESMDSSALHEQGEVEVKDESSDKEVKTQESERVVKQVATPQKKSWRENPGDTSKEIMRRAQSARAGRDWAQAVTSYEALINKYPLSAEARTARVSLAGIQLNQFGKGREALKNYDRYLALSPDGALAQEASFGRARALAGLGKDSQALSAYEEFLLKYPNSFGAREARRKIAELGKIK